MTQLGERQTIKGRYWNTGGNGITVVAVIAYGVDWVAYIGTDPRWDGACVEHTAENGAKLSVKDARHFFPDIKLPYRA